MKLALLFLLASLSGCVVVQERVRTEYKTLPPKIIERHFLIVPTEPAEDEAAKEKIERNKEAQNFA